MPYAELHCLSNFSFLRSASHPHELVARAAKLGYRAIAITDECSLAGVVKAHVAARDHHIQLIIGSEFLLAEAVRIVLLAPDKTAYSQLSSLITLARRRCSKGEYRLSLKDLETGSGSLLAIWLPDFNNGETQNIGACLKNLFPGQLWVGINNLLGCRQKPHYFSAYKLARELGLPMLACGHVLMHHPDRKPLLDTLTAIRLKRPVQELGTGLTANSEQHLRPLARLKKLYPAPLLEETLRVAGLCRFSLQELRYEYPAELVPDDETPHGYLRKLVFQGARKRWPGGASGEIQSLIEKELQLIRELQYEYYFLTVFDIVAFARSQSILCQGRGSAANSVVCYCLFITEVDPSRLSVLFERFISKERNEPPDIDVDFEHQRREEVIQYIYRKYGRDRAALAATVITYRPRSAIRDVGKALGFDASFIDQLASSLAWWDRKNDLLSRLQQSGMSASAPISRHFIQLVQEILGFPRHLSQHVGGFVISRNPISSLVPVENAAMPGRSVIQWDKLDIEALGLLKVDVLALGMLSAIRRCLALVGTYQGRRLTLADIPPEDPQTYKMLCRGDSIGVFQVESRAQISMLPRLQPRCFYDLVIEVAIVRPGPIQGDMVHPYLKRRQGLEPVSYPDDAVRSVLERTLGVPIFQEQVIQLAMVAAGFTGGEADRLRRAMASWGKNGNLGGFERRLVEGMRARGHSEEFAKRLFRQIQGFGEYGFPESHSASFALLVYASAWLKCHHPAAFYCALLNSQPMGFYSPSQLVQDARRHDVRVLPVMVEHSDWDHQLETGSNPAPSIRLGMRLVKGFERQAAERIVRARNKRPFSSLRDLSRRARLQQNQLNALIHANALRKLGSHRRQAHWQARAIETGGSLLERHEGTTSLDDGVRLIPPSEISDLHADYNSTGLTLNRHPMAILRNENPFNRCKTHSQLGELGHGRFVRLAGLVTGRQRPGTASGVIFLTLEDETGNTNVVVWRNLQTRFRQPLLTGKLLLVKGILEHQDSVTHVIAGEIIDYSHKLEGVAMQSRDFH
jgi:error-prone DNA polymerase